MLGEIKGWLGGLPGPGTVMEVGLKGLADRDGGSVNPTDEASCVPPTCI